MDLQTPTTLIPTIFLIGYLVAGMLATILAIYIVRFRWEQPAARAFAAVLILVGIWAFAYAGRMVSVNLSTKLIWTQLAWVGITLTPVAILVFSLIFTGRGDTLSRNRILALLLIPAATQVMLLTNSSHHLFYRTVSIHSDNSLQLIASRAGLWFYGVHLPYSWALFLVATLFLVQFAVTATDMYRGQAFALVFGVVFAWLVNGTFLADIRIHPELDPTPVGIAIGLTVIGLAVFQNRFLSLIPVAYEQVFNELDECIFILDDDDRLVDLNASGESFLAVHAPSGWALGGHPNEIFPRRVNEARIASAGTNPGREIKFPGDGWVEWYWLRTYPFRDKMYSGTILLLSDISGVKHQQRSIEQKNESLEQVGSIMAHDVRNPLSVAKGYLQIIRDASASMERPAGKPGEIESAISNIERAHDRIESIIDDVLLLAQNEDEITETGTIDLEWIARTAWDNVQASGLTLAIEESGTFQGDRSQLLRVLENLFRNAVEHGETATTIRVGRIPDGFYVEDDGVGAPAEGSRTLFDMGVSGDGGGTGLGLSIVQSVIQAHGWTIEATTSSEGGLRFEIHGVEIDEKG